MPELVTHAIAGCLLARRHLVLVFVGALLPDLLTRIPNALFSFLKIAGGEDWVRPLHSPVPLVLVALLLSFLFDSSIRRQVFSALMLGIMSHLVLDFFQRRTPDPGWQIVPERGYQWLFPFSQFDFQFGLYGPEASLLLLPLTVPLLAWYLWTCRKRHG